MGNTYVRWEAEGKIRIVTIDHPPVNALNKDVITQLDQTFEQFWAENEEIGIVIITGAGNKAFVAGADINELPALDQWEGVKLSRRGQGVFKKIADFPAPVIAAISGFALGGGCELALACDIRVAAPNARLGLPEVSLGIIPGYGGTQRLPRVVAVGKAKELIFTGDQIPAEEAYRIGLVDRLAPDGDVLAEAKRLAARILERGPVAIRFAKKAVNQGLECPLEQGLAWEAELMGKACATEDKNEGTTAFLAKRPPQFKGR